ncbi:DUF1566 domain-containing protein [Arcobacter sp. FWKO B]|uniref:Lcl C-terminal domain-containing protein n=1 Tax=Arcobacter sp. FWKO B TaxID=2593672 RepID=UPI0018A64E08|nr:DUF1566 domain-containing protein [Arcobacter sp. FWKO B]QOG12327.1 DUF1566 domain-containing protein [Arcobacter sp. FWKO B]
MLRIITIFLVSLNFLLSSTLIKHDNEEIVIDTSTNLMWQDSIDNKMLRLSWQESLEYCEKLSFGGFDDWRVPTHTELLTIVEKNKYNPSISNVFTNTINGFYWTSTEVKGRSAAWYIRFDFGRDGSINMTSKNYVRCVRTQ